MTLTGYVGAVGVLVPGAVRIPGMGVVYTQVVVLHGCLVMAWQFRLGAAAGLWPSGTVGSVTGDAGSVPNAFHSAVEKNRF